MNIGWILDYVGANSVGVIETMGGPDTMGESNTLGITWCYVWTWTVIKVGLTGTFGQKMRNNKRPKFSQTCMVSLN